MKTMHFLLAAVIAAASFMFFACSGNESSEGYNPFGTNGGGVGLSSSSSSSSSSASEPLELIPNPDPPAGVITSTNSTNSISVGWGAVSGATGYYIYRSINATDTYAQIGSSATTSYIDNGLSPGTTYYYRVSGYNSGGTGSQSSVVSATTQPDAPVGVAAAANSANGITVSWSASIGASGYRIYRSESGEADTYIQIGASSTTSYASTGLTMATKYYYRVAAYNVGGEGPQSEAVFETTLPFVPTGVVATVNSPTSIIISWEAVSGAASYRIYRSTDGEADTYVQVGTSSTVSYTNSSLATGTTYYYRVSAYSSTNGEGALSEMVYETPRVVPPSAPQNFNATPGNGQVTLSWSAPSSNGGSAITGYQVSSDNGSLWVVASGNTSHTFTGLGIGTSYEFRVRAVNAIGSGAEAFASATTWTTPSAPQNFTATPGNGQAVLSWVAPSSNGGGAITGYQVSSNNGSSWVAASSNTGHTFTGLANGTSYTFRVRAVNAVGGGAEASASATPRTTPSAPQNFTATPSNNQQITLSWTAPSSNGGSAITGYQVSSNNGSSWVAASSNTGHVFNGLTNGTSYTFRVRAVNALGNGAEASASAAPILIYGSVTHEGQTYKTVVIGTQTWMAENLNYNVSGSRCYGDDQDNCAKYGRLYDWATAMDLPNTCSSDWNMSCSNLVQATHQGICPSGWHIPSDTEWMMLIDYAGEVAGTKLKATSDWNSSAVSVAGTDIYGFTALPGGCSGSSNNNFFYIRVTGFWWGASEQGNGNYYASVLTMDAGHENANTSHYPRNELYSVRCVKD